MNVPLQRRGKDFLPRAHVRYLVGYSEEQRDVYRIWLPLWNIIVTSTNVEFDENIPQGEIDFKTDEYWMDIRKSKTLNEDIGRNSVDDYLLLKKH